MFGLHVLCVLPFLLNMCFLCAKWERHLRLLDLLLHIAYNFGKGALDLSLIFWYYWTFSCLCFAPFVWIAMNFRIFPVYLHNTDDSECTFDLCLSGTIVDAAHSFAWNAHNKRSSDAFNCINCMMVRTCDKNI